MAFDGWSQQTWDEHDTVLESEWYDLRDELTDGEGRAADLTEATPTRPPRRTSMRWGERCSDEMPFDETTYKTVVTLDVQGNPTVPSMVG